MSSVPEKSPANDSLDESLRSYVTSLILDPVDEVDYLRCRPIPLVALSSIRAKVTVHSLLLLDGARHERFDVQLPGVANLELPVHSLFRVLGMTYFDGHCWASAL